MAEDSPPSLPTVAPPSLPTVGPPSLSTVGPQCGTLEPDEEGISAAYSVSDLLNDLSSESEVEEVFQDCNDNGLSEKINSGNEDTLQSTEELVTDKQLKSDNANDIYSTARKSNSNVEELRDNGF